MLYNIYQNYICVVYDLQYTSVPQGAIVLKYFHVTFDILQWRLSYWES